MPRGYPLEKQEMWFQDEQAVSKQYTEAYNVNKSGRTVFNLFRGK